ncbi:MAG: DotU family type IV/VI secretion system protein [Amylibacter sp.]|nr:DotU family type IV/VI secretion system protein [Amylibacter sp.]
MTKSNENPRTLTITGSGIENLQSQSDLQRPETGSMLEWHELTETMGQFNSDSNQLLKISAHMMAACGTLGRVPQLNQVQVTQQQLCTSLIDLKYRIVAQDYPPSVAENLCLMYAIFLDEAALTSEWGLASGWENRSLVADLFGFRDGGQRFYSIVERAMLQPKALAEFLFIAHALLKLGFRGCYSAGKDHLRSSLIKQLEVTLSVTESEVPQRSVMESLAQAKAPSFEYSMWSKLSILIILVVLLYGTEYGFSVMQSDLLRDELTLRQERAQSSPLQEYIYSSVTDTTVKKTQGNELQSSSTDSD